MQVSLDFNDMQESLKSSGYTNRKLAMRFKVTHTTVNSYFNKKGKFDFMHFVDALRLYKPKDIKFRRNCIKECIPTLSHKNLKLALEVLDMFGEYELQDMIMQQINKFKSNQTETEKERKKGISKTVRINLNLVPLY
ncbi:AimR family lysis-lysogeny pheromone receptor, partial [Bacillus thuringiensis]|nr:AimR family lysis-lysogeny pheromone receptor [Bacillus thuringiensis]